MKTAIAFIFFIAFVGLQKVTAQPFIEEIQNFQQEDSIQPPPQHAILFVGSSSFRKWTDVQTYFPGYSIINRGFGGSTLPDVIRYANDIIFPYHPKQIFIYCGDNDLALSDTITSQMVYNRFKELFTLIRSNLKDVNIVFVAIKPSPSRQTLMPKMEDANRLIKNFLKGKSNASFADVYHPMLASDGKPMPDIFEADNLHMNAKGYAIWEKVLKPYLIN